MTDQTPDPWRDAMEALKHLARDIGTVDDIAGRRSDPDHDHQQMRARLRAWRVEILKALDMLGARPQSDALGIARTANALLRERDAQIARLSAQVRKLEAELALARSAGSRDLNLRMNEANKALRAERDAAQQQIATLTQELSVSRANHIDANQRNMQSVRELEAAEARCATLQGAVAADEERLRQAAARAGVLFVGCDTADALADRCATLTAAMERALTFHQTTHIHAVLRAAIDAHQQGVPTP